MVIGVRQVSHCIGLRYCLLTALNSADRFLLLPTSSPFNCGMHHSSLPPTLQIPLLSPLSAGGGTFLHPALHCWEPSPPCCPLSAASLFWVCSFNSHLYETTPNHVSAGGPLLPTLGLRFLPPTWLLRRHLRLISFKLNSWLSLPCPWKKARFSFSILYMSKHNIGHSSVPVRNPLPSPSLHPVPHPASWIWPSQWFSALSTSLHHTE